MYFSDKELSLAHSESGYQPLFEDSTDVQHHSNNLRHDYVSMTVATPSLIEEFSVLSGHTIASGSFRDSDMIMTSLLAEEHSGQIGNFETQDQSSSHNGDELFIEETHELLAPHNLIGMLVSGYRTKYSDVQALTNSDLGLEVGTKQELSAPRFTKLLGVLSSVRILVLPTTTFISRTFTAYPFCPGKYAYILDIACAFLKDLSTNVYAFRPMAYTNSFLRTRLSMNCPSPLRTALFLSTANFTSMCRSADCYFLFLNFTQSCLALFFPFYSWKWKWHFLCVSLLGAITYYYMKSWEDATHHDINVGVLPRHLRRRFHPT